jgi:hypothetical protein
MDPESRVLTREQMDVLRDIAKSVADLIGLGPETTAMSGIVCALIKTVEPQIIEIRRQKDRARGFQLMARHMFEWADERPWLAAMEDGKYERVGGDVECKVCRQTYFEHPQLPNLPTFHIICGGTIVKT